MVYLGENKIPSVDSLGGKTGDITLGDGLSIDNSNVLSPDIATSSEVSNLYANDTKKFIVLSNMRTLVSQLGVMINGVCQELKTLINAKVSNVKVDNTSVVSDNVATINTINADYNASTNKLATANDIEDLEDTTNKVTSFSASSTDTQYPSAKAVYTETSTLQDEIDNLKARGRFLSLWDCETGLPLSEPTSVPYEYKTGDYFIVSNVVEEGDNYKPEGTEYISESSTTVEELEVAVDDVYYYDGSAWKLQQNTQKTVSFANIAGQPTDNTNLNAALSGKANVTTTVTHTASTAVGDSKTPVYVASNGAATALSYTIEKSVPSDAVFTDTTYSDATQSASGLMSSTDKTKLDDLSIATASEVSNLYSGDTKKFIVFSNIQTLVTQLVAHVNSWGTELRALINAKVSNVKVDSTSVVSDNVAIINTINANYNASTNKLATGSEIDTLQDEIDNLKARGRYLSQWNCATGQPATQPSSLPYTYKSGDYFIVGTVASGNYTHHITVQGTSSSGLHEGTNTYNVTFDLVNQTASAYTTLAGIVAAMADETKYAATGTVVNTTEGTINIVKVIKWLSGIGFLQADEQKACITDSEPTSITDTVSGGSSTNYKPDGTSYTGTASSTAETTSVSVEDTYYFDGTTWHLQQNTQKTVSFANLAGQPSDNTALNTALTGKISSSEKGAASGVATLGTDGKVPSAQIPSLGYLPLAGGTMDSGAAINMGGGQIRYTTDSTTPANSALEINSERKVKIQSDEIDVDSSIIPSTDNAKDLGSTSKSFKDVYARKIRIFDFENESVAGIYSDRTATGSLILFADSGGAIQCKASDGITDIDLVAGDIYQNGTKLDETYLGKHDTADAAEKLETARTIALSGAVSGSASFDGSGDITISTSGVDIQANGTSIVSSGVANIVTQYGNYNASTNKILCKNDGDALYLGKTAKAASASIADSVDWENVDNAPKIMENLTGVSTIHMYALNEPNDNPANTELELFVLNGFLEASLISNYEYDCHFTLYCNGSVDGNYVAYTDLENHFRYLVDTGELSMVDSYCGACTSETVGGTEWESGVSFDEGASYGEMTNKPFFKMLMRHYHEDDEQTNVVGPFVIDLYCRLNLADYTYDANMDFKICHSNTQHMIS